MSAIPDTHRVRALLLDGDDLILFARSRPGVAPYWVTPGGGVEPGDASLIAALHRELREELEATVHCAHPLTFLEVSHPDGERVRHHLYACLLAEMDFANATAAEFSDPGRGSYEVVRVPFTVEALAPLNIQPQGLAGYLRENIDYVWQRAHSGQSSYGVYFETGASLSALKLAIQEIYGISDVFTGTIDELAAGREQPPLIWIDPESADPPFGCELSAGDALARRTGASELELATRLCAAAGLTALVSDTSTCLSTWYRVTPDGAHSHVHLAD